MAIRKRQPNSPDSKASTQNVARKYKRFFDLYQTEYSNFFLHIDLFNEHQIESNTNSIQISDEAFEHIFTFFDMYFWQLDSQASPCENIVTPDIFVYIFERRINQKEMGAFYTQGDITAYIA